MTFSFSRQFDYPYTKEIEISDSLRCVTANNPSPFTFTGTNSFIIGRGNVAILDPGPDDDAHLDALLTATKGEIISHILISHTHKDHVALTSKLQEKTGAKTYAYSAHAVKAEEEFTKIETLDDSRDRTFTPDISLAHNEEIKIGNIKLQALHTPGHTEDHLCFSLPEEKALLCGDHVMGWSTSIIAPPDGHMGDYIFSLELLLERPDIIYHPTHGNPVTEPHVLVEHLINHRAKREAAILDLLSKGPASIEEVVKVVYRGLDRELIGAAMLSTWAQLIWLQEKKQVKNISPDKNHLSESSYQLI